MEIIEANMTFAGGYRCEVSTKDKFDSSNFNLAVNGKMNSCHLVSSFYWGCFFFFLPVCPPAILSGTQRLLDKHRSEAQT